MAQRVAALLNTLRAIAAERRFLHWQPAFPGVWTSWQTATPEGGFDAVVGNPPYVRQEQIKDRKPGLKARFPKVFDGVADLYVYFFAQALALLRPGGRFAFVVTNKWLKAGYAEALRGQLETAAWVESMVDFGHAKQFFPGTDVMPSVLCARRPLGKEEPPDTVSVAVLPRDSVQYAALTPQVEAAAFPLPRAVFTRHPWVLEPPPVLALIKKLHTAGVPLKEYAGSAPMYGVKTGFNDAFVVDQATRDRLVAADPNSAKLIHPFLRGEDILRWSSDWDGQHMIFPHRGLKIESYPSLLEHLTAFRSRLEPKPSDWPKKENWGGRKAGSYKWFETQDPVSYWSQFLKPKIVIQRIAVHPAFAVDACGYFCNDSAIFVPTTDNWLLGVLNSPVVWWRNFKLFPHKKDEALAMDIPFVEMVPIARPDATAAARAAVLTTSLAQTAREAHAARRLLDGWYRTEWGLPKIPERLANPFALDANGFAAELRAALPANHRALSAAAVASVRAEHAATVAPMAARLAVSRANEIELSALVNAAYGLTPEDEALLWATAPPRMPIPKPT